MDPIQPIEPHPPWISPLAPAQRQSDRSKPGQRERRRTPRSADSEPRSGRKPPGEEHGPGEHGSGEDGSEGRHIDVRA